MNKKILKQYDSRWASKPYPSGCTVGGCGCGLLACTHIAMEQASKKDWTPENLRPWMLSKGFAVKNQGTRWEGITETLKHIGHKSVVRIYSDPMSKAFEELDKGNRIGILLFNSNKAPNGIRWTASGHYVAFTDYKVKDKKHYFYCKDSGGRNHDGWYTYENSMKGCISKVWIVERVGKQVASPVIKATTYKPSKAYTGTLPGKSVKKGSKGTDAKAVQKFLNWCIKAGLTVDGVAGDYTDAAIRIYQKTYKLSVDGVFGPASLKKAKKIIAQFQTPADKIVAWAEEQTKKGYVYVNWDGSQKAKECPLCHDHSKNGKYYGWNCIGFVSACLYHGLGLKSITCANNGFLGGNDNYTYLLSHSLKEAQAYVDKKLGKGLFKVIKDDNKTLSESKLKRSDIVIYYKGNEFWHIADYIGNGKIIDSSSGTNTVKKRSWKRAYPCKVAIRYVGK